VPDYSEFPTTPTAWQEAQLRDWQTVTPLETEDPPAKVEPKTDRVALVPGIFFVVLAIIVMSGLDLPFGLFANGGLLWLVLIGAGIVLLMRELGRARSKR
jgi:hypothetical protein